MHLDVLQDCKIVSANDLEKIFQPLRSITDNIYRVFCTKSIYVHLVKSGRGVGTYPPSRFIFYLRHIRKSPLKMAFGVQCFMLIYSISIRSSLREVIQ